MQVTDEMIEAAARALVRIDIRPNTYSDDTNEWIIDSQWSLFKDEARAALEAALSVPDRGGDDDI